MDSKNSAQFDSEKWIIEWNNAEKQCVIIKLNCGKRSKLSLKKRWKDGLRREFSKKEVMLLIIESSIIFLKIGQNSYMMWSVCVEKPCENGGRLTRALTIVDLKFASLEVHVVRMIWEYQLVRYKRKTYFLVLLGFGLNIASKLMATILKMLLRKWWVELKKAIDFYIDDTVW